MTRQEEAIFEAKAERHFKGQRELIPGRNFLWNAMRYHTQPSVRDAYSIGQCRTFPESPGNRMCGACDIENCDIREGGKSA
jgi:hypothetical protein